MNNNFDQESRQDITMSSDKLDEESGIPTFIVSNSNNIGNPEMDESTSGGVGCDDMMTFEKKEKQKSWITATTSASASNSSKGEGEEGDVEEQEQQEKNDVDDDDDDDDHDHDEDSYEPPNITISNIEANSNDKDKGAKASGNSGASGSGYSRREHLFVVGVGILLSFNSGYVNGSCLSGLLTSNHISQSVAGFTGAYTISALALAKGSYAIFGYQIKMILSFIFGSCISGFLTPHAIPYQIAPTYGPTFLIGGIFLTTASILSASHVEKYYFFYLAAAANGIQNGISSLYSANLIRSTHLTGTSTDIGLFIGQYLRGNKTNLWKLRVLVSLASSFWLGGFISFYATSALTSWSLLFNAGLFLLIGIGIMVFLMLEYHISAKAALLGTWQWNNALESLSTLSTKSQLTTSMMNVFDIVDSDKSGNINRDELYNALKTSGLQDVNMRDTDNMMKFADKDGDGVISRDEWRKVVSSVRSSRK